MSERYNRDMDDIPEKIRKALSQAMDSMDFGQLNRIITDTVDSALDEAKTAWENYRTGAVGTARTVVVDEPKKQLPALRVNRQGRVSSTLMTVFGGIGTGVFGLSTLSFLGIALILIGDGFAWWVTGILALMTGGSGVMLANGLRRKGILTRLERYLLEIRRQGKTYAQLEDLGRATGQKIEAVRKDFRQVLRLGMLPDVKMDDQETCLILDDETYRQYRQSQEALKDRQQLRMDELLDQQRSYRDEAAGMMGEETRPDGAKQFAGRDSAYSGSRQGGAYADGQQGGAYAGGQASRHGDIQDPSVSAAIARGEEYMDTLDRIRESIPACPMIEKLQRLDNILERLFDTLKKYPDQLDELEKFMEYYLPTTVKLVTAYQEFAEVEFPGENINHAKAEIEKTMDTINGAFEKLLDDMYQDTAFDVVTDASVLQAMLAREGLTEDDFKIR